MSEILPACFQLDEFCQGGCLRPAEGYRVHSCLVHAGPPLAVRSAALPPICPEMVTVLDHSRKPIALAPSSSTPHEGHLPLAVLQDGWEIWEKHRGDYSDARGSRPPQNPHTFADV